ncbi:ribosome biogenesis protein SLX9-domain-containing protein [Cantharellus anzutake]|uniref:ribosome biogenesis protein SLX9-domain-containing protein n=1 Tax=Cantharellus anzutake TaxID=1750568 RepID=UPI001902C4B3|nr:ribosome biogenesis protein SLX9-domain-containing protein [Cantharellus anzutake]KAF8337901.1 ribosome biogenesis protein SLX9-domain-containing protein [Cantharellus anzutake]
MRSLKATPSQAKPRLTKKEKLRVKREMFIKKINSSQTPYSKLRKGKQKHKAKQKSKQKQKLTANLTGLESALNEIVIASQKDDSSHTKNPSSSRGVVERLKPEPIGEGNGTPLTQKERRKTLLRERERAALVHANPAFSSNPFTVARRYAENVLVPHTVPDKSQSQ